MSPSVLVEVRGADPARWDAALRAALPGARFVSDAEPSVDYLIAWRPRAQCLARTRVRKAIFNLGAGVDFLLGLPTLPPDVPIYRLMDAGMSAQMADYALAAVLQAFRDFDAYAALQASTTWQPREPRERARFGVGVLGAGMMGRAVIAALLPFGFALRGYARAPHDDAQVPMFYGESALRDFLSGCDVAICLLPATPATRGLFDAQRLSWLPRGAHLVNVARGELVVDEDLVAALDSGHLGGATLDVFRTEPLPREHPFWHHPRVRMTPHVAAVTLVAESVAQVAAGIRALEAGDDPPGRVDRARGY